MKTFFKLVLVTCFVAALNSCTLDLQDEFKFKPEINDTDPFANMTAWDYIQTRTTSAIADSQGRIILNGEELDLMIAAIKRVGYEDLYNQTATTNRTYLLLNNNAFTGNTLERDIIRTITGRQLGVNSRVIPETVFDNYTEEQLNVLKAMLKYHIVGDFVAQVPTIPTFDFDLLFKTLLPVVNLNELGQPTGLSDQFTDIAFRRDTRWIININNPEAPLPPTANEVNLDENVRNHNFVFNNGIGHYLNEIVRFQPYALYTNLSVD